MALPTLSELIKRWEEARQRGENPTAADICHDCPELADELERVLALLGLLPNLTLTTLPQAPTLPQDQPTEYPSETTEAQTLATVPPLPNSAALLPAIPGYEIHGELGRGGMGVVYRAKHLALKRTVALKMILSGACAGTDERRRFRIEAEAIARLQHPGIVQVFETGEYEGRPYLVLEFCAGGSLADRLNGTPLPSREAAGLIEKIALGVAAAHDQGIIHRDLKPGNVLLQKGHGPESRGHRDANQKSEPVAPHLDTAPCPLSALHPRVTDFGLARFTLGDAGAGAATATATATGAVMGTPCYMAPEQAQGKLDQLSPATDVYALGSILYECLTGRPPFRASNAMDTLLQVVHNEPVPPGRLQPGTPRDLETICLACLHKDAAKRYPHARELADDLRAWLEGHPIKARPVTTLERTWKWARRRPALSAMGAICVLIGLISYVLISWQWLEATRARDLASTARDHASRELERAEQTLYLNRIALADREWVGRNRPRMLEVLGLCPVARRDWEWGYLRHAGEDGLFSLSGHEKRLTGLASGPVPGQLASASQDGTIRLWDLRTEKSIELFHVDQRLSALARSPDGKYLAAGTSDGRLVLWELARGQRIAERQQAHKGAITDLAFRPGKVNQLASAGEDQQVHLWDLSLQKPVVTLHDHANAISRIAFDPKGECLASGAWDNLVLVWDIARGKELYRCEGHLDGVRGVAFSPDGLRLASCAGDQTIRLQDARTGKLLQLIRGHTSTIHTVAFSPDSTRLVSASADGTARVWEVETGRERLRLSGRMGPVHMAAFCAEGRWVATASGENQLTVWDARHEPTSQVATEDAGPVTDLALAPDGRTAAVLAGEGKVRIHDLATRRILFDLQADQPMEHVAICPVSGRIASACSDRSIWLWDPRGKPLAGPLRGYPGKVEAMQFHPLGQWLASAGRDERIYLWDPLAGKEVRHWHAHEDTVRALAHSPDGNSLVSVGEDRRIRVWDTATGTKRAEAVLPGGSPTRLAWSDDGKSIAVATDEGSVLVWLADLSGQTETLRGHQGAVRDLVFAPGSRRLFTAGEDRLVRIYAVAQAQEALNLRGHDGPVLRLAISADGKRLLSGSEDQTIRVWNSPANE